MQLPIGARLVKLLGNVSNMTYLFFSSLTFSQSVPNPLSSLQPRSPRARTCGENGQSAHADERHFKQAGNIGRPAGIARTSVRLYCQGKGKANLYRTTCVRQLTMLALFRFVVVSLAKRSTDVICVESEVCDTTDMLSVTLQAWTVRCLLPHVLQIGNFSRHLWRYTGC